MESYNNFLQNSQNAQKQLQSQKRSYTASQLNITSSLSSKNDIYDYLKNNRQYYVPPFEMFTKGKSIFSAIKIFLDFAKEIFEGKKKLLKLADIKLIAVIKYDELSVKGLYSKFMTLDGMAQYFPA